MNNLIPFTLIWIIMSCLTRTWNVSWFLCIIIGFVITILGILLVKLSGKEEYNE